MMMYRLGFLASLIEGHLLTRIPASPDALIFGPQEVVESEAVTFMKDDDLKIKSERHVSEILHYDAIEKPVGTVTHWRFEFSDGDIVGAVGLTNINKSDDLSIVSVTQEPDGYLSAPGVQMKNWTQPYSNPSVIDWYMERPEETVLKIYSVVNGDVQVEPATINFQNYSTVHKLVPIVLYRLTESQKPGRTRCTFRMYKQYNVIDEDSFDTEPKYSPDGGDDDNSGVKRSYRNAVSRTGVIDTWVFDEQDFDGARIIIDSNGNVTANYLSKYMDAGIKLFSFRETSGNLSNRENNRCEAGARIRGGSLGRVERLICQTWSRSPDMRHWILEGDRLVIGTTVFTRLPLRVPTGNAVISAQAIGLE